MEDALRAFLIRVAALERNPIKCAALFGKIARQNKKLERGFGSTKSHSALAAYPCDPWQKP
jgi:hypothetical protein